MVPEVGLEPESVDCRVFERPGLVGFETLSEKDLLSYLVGGFTLEII